MQVRTKGHCICDILVGNDLLKSSRVEILPLWPEVTDIKPLPPKPNKYHCSPRCAHLCRCGVRQAPGCHARAHSWTRWGQPASTHTARTTASRSTNNVFEVSAHEITRSEQKQPPWNITPYTFASFIPISAPAAMQVTSWVRARTNQQCRWLQLSSALHTHFTLQTHFSSVFLHKLDGTAAWV